MKKRNWKREQKVARYYLARCRMILATKVKPLQTERFLNMPLN